MSIYQRRRDELDLKVILAVHHLTLFPCAKLGMLDACLTNAAGNIARDTYSLILHGTNGSLPRSEASTTYNAALGCKVLLEGSEKSGRALPLGGTLYSYTFILIAQLDNLWSNNFMPNDSCPSAYYQTLYFLGRPTRVESLLPGVPRSQIYGGRCLLPLPLLLYP
jgi:hypothetical protein